MSRFRRVRRGIGAETASLFASEGAQVIISGRNAERGEQVAQAIASAGGQARFVLADLTDLDPVRVLADAAGGLDILINNAAAFVAGPTVEQDPEGLEESFATNDVRGPYVLNH